MPWVSKGNWVVLLVNLFDFLEFQVGVMIVREINALLSSRSKIVKGCHTSGEDVLIIDWSIIASIPPTIGRLQKLHELGLTNTRKLENLSEEIDDLVSMHKLNLYRSGIISLPSSIGRLRNLNDLVSPIQGVQLEQIESKSFMDRLASVFHRVLEASPRSESLGIRDFPTARRDWRPCQLEQIV